MYHITIDTASKHIRKLEKFGLIKCIYDHNDKNTKRIIRLVDDIWNKYSIRDRLNNPDDIVYLNRHNNKYNRKKNMKIIYLYLHGLMRKLKLFHQV